MTHDTTPPKRIWADDDGYWSSFDPSEIKTVVGEYILTSEAEAMVAAALREAANTIAEISEGIGGFISSGIKKRVLALIPQPAAAALDKLIAEAVKAERERCAKIADIESCRLERDAYQADEQGHDTSADMDREGARNCKELADLIRAAKGEAK